MLRYSHQDIRKHIQTNKVQKEAHNKAENLVKEQRDRKILERPDSHILIDILDAFAAI